MFSFDSKPVLPPISPTAAATASASPFSELIIPSIKKLIDPNTSAVSVAKDLIDAAGTSAGATAADLAVPDGVEIIARLIGADGLLAKYGPGHAASAVTKPVVEKLVSGPIMKACMSVLENYSSLLSLTISGITALQIGVVAAAGVATGYALYKFFTSRKAEPKKPEAQPIEALPTPNAFA